MDVTLSRPIKVLALVGLLVAVAGAGMLALNRSSKDTSTALPSAAELQAQHRASEKAKAASAPKAATTHKTVPAVHKAAPAKPVASKPHVARKPALVAANGLPMALVRALRHHRIVVISLFDPQSTTDAISFAEARAGAADAGVGFLGVSVLNNDVAGPLTAVLPSGGLLPVPGLLIYRRPGTLVQRIDGFVDRDAVAQAAVASFTAPPR